MVRGVLPTSPPIPASRKNPVWLAFCAVAIPIDRIAMTNTKISFFIMSDYVVDYSVSFQESHSADAPLETVNVGVCFLWLMIEELRETSFVI